MEKVNIVEQFAEFKRELREKLIDYYEANWDFIYRCYGGNTPDYSFILGVLTLLYPEARQGVEFYLTHVTKGSGKATDAIPFLDLNFSPGWAIEERRKQRKTEQAA